MKRIYVILSYASLLFLGGCSAEKNRLKKAMESFRLEPGLRIELVASEPLVVDPVALAFDENRALYVVEDRGYPDPVDSGAAPTKLGQVALLRDIDGDGIYDRRANFVTGLTYPNGVLPWRGGVFVTCAPNIYYFRDTTGDGVADIKKIVLTGFNADKTAQIRVSTPILGLDGWVYISGGLNSGDISSPDHPERPKVSYASGDGRFNPDTYEFQVTGGVSQFGLAFDPYGRRFGCSNRHPMQLILMEPSALRRNSHLLFTQTYEDVSNAEADAKVFPISHAKTSADFIPTLIGRSHTGTFTSACGLMVFNGTALTPAHRGNAFICEPAQNLIQRQVVHQHGVSYRSELPYQDRDFLASTDESFRPVYLQHGPDGALYVADMSRKVIDHPSYVPEEARGGLDFESGKSDGRIYRIVRENFQGPAGDENGLFLPATSSGQIAKALESEEEWTRSTAFRLLLESKDATCIPLLKHLSVDSKYPETRTRALWLLQLFNVIDEAIVKKSLEDSEAGVREQAVLLTESFIASHPKLTGLLLTTATDTSTRVRFNTALVLGNFNDPRVAGALAGIAAKDGDDKWIRAAVLSGIGTRLPVFLAKFQDKEKVNPLAFAAVMQDLGRLFGNGEPVAACRVLLKNMIGSAVTPGWRISAVLGLAEGLSGREEIKMSAHGILFSLLGEGASKREKAMLERFIHTVAESLGDISGTARDRVMAAGLLGYTPFETSGSVLGTLLGTSHPPEVQLAAIASLARLGDERGFAMLTDKIAWSGYTPRVRSAVIAALVSKPAYIKILFTAIRQGIIGAPEISSMDRERLLKDTSAGIRSQAALLFKEFEGEGRMKVYKNYKSILDKEGDAGAGEPVFKRVCSTCHMQKGLGGKVGPDLTGVSNQPADALLLHILVPNYEVLPAYQAIAVQTKDNRSISGWLVSETENSVTLRTAFGTEESILRANITSLVNSGLSLMPDGLEKAMTKDELRNLVAFLKAGS